MHLGQAWCLNGCSGWPRSGTYEQCSICINILTRSGMTCAGSCHQWRLSAAPQSSAQTRLAPSPPIRCLFCSCTAWVRCSSCCVLHQALLSILIAHCTAYGLHFIAISRFTSWYQRHLQHALWYDGAQRLMVQLRWFLPLRCSGLACHQLCVIECADSSCVHGRQGGRDQGVHSGGHLLQS